MKMLARWRDPSMEKVIMGYFANPGLVKTQIAMSLGRSADDASILQREYSRWDSHGQYTVIICLRYYPSIQVLDKLTHFEALTVEDMEKSLSKCCTRNDRIWIKDVYSDRLFTIRKSIAEIKSNLIFYNYSKLAEFVSKFRLFYAKNKKGRDKMLSRIFGAVTGGRLNLRAESM